MASFFFIIAVILLVQSVLALAGVYRFARYSLHARQSRHRYQPKAAVIVPCKGIDLNFAENIGALFAQDYRDYELIFVTESEADPAYAVLTRLIEQHQRAAWLVVAGEAVRCSQKIHNLRAALETLDAVNRRAEIIAFADSDARPSAQWLSELAAPLIDESIGATTGFRWYLPAAGRPAGFWSLLLSVWNASALAFLGERSAFAWGGAMAIRRENLQDLGIRQKWENAVSDDYVLSTAVKAAGQRIKFVPACLSATPVAATWKSLLEFTTRQLTITRVYARSIWQMTLLTQLLYNVTFWGGLAYLVTTALRGTFQPDLAIVLAGIFVLGAVAGAARAVIVARLLEEDQHQIADNWGAYVLLTPLTALVWLWNLCASALTKKITWRGISYEMISPEETVVLHREQLSDQPLMLPEITKQSEARVTSTSTSWPE